MDLSIREENRKAMSAYLCTWSVVFFRHLIYKLTMRLTLFGLLWHAAIAFLKSFFFLPLIISSLGIVWKA